MASERATLTAAMLYDAGREDGRRDAAAEIARMKRDLEALRRIAVDLHWMARRYVDGRTSYATRLFNDHTRALLAMGVELNSTADGTIWARDAMGRAYDGLSEEEAALGLPAPDGLYDEDVARLRRELEAARERERRLREVILAELYRETADGGSVAPVTELDAAAVERLWRALIATYGAARAGQTHGATGGQRE